MARRGENIYKRKDGRWEARIQIGRNSSGKTQYRSVYGHSYKEIRQKKADLSRVIEQSKESLDVSSAVSFGDVLYLWLIHNRPRLKEQTLLKYKYCIDSHIMPLLGSLSLNQITATTINQFLSEKKENGRLDCTGGLSPNYIRTISIIIQSAINYAVTEGLCIPLRGHIYKPPNIHSEIRVLSRTEQQKLEQYLEQNPTASSLAIYLSLHLGLRIGEVCALKWTDIDFTNMILYVNHSVIRLNKNHHTELLLGEPKSRASRRVIPFCHSTYQILCEEQKRSNSKYVISNGETKSFFNPRTLENHYKAALLHCGLPKLNYHVLRHTFATRCIESGTDVKTLSQMLGHTSVNITMDLYVHPSIALKRQALERLEAFSSQQDGQMMYQIMEE